MTRIKYIKIGLVFTLLIASYFSSFAQLSKANDYFNNEQYSDAINYYEKTLKKDTLNKEAIQNIAFSYKKLKEYSNAEIYYAKAIALNPNESSNIMYYGQSLKNNNKIKEAKVQFQKFVEKNPTSLIGKLMVQSCGDIANWDVEDKAFEVTTIPNINTENADFCPLVYKDGIVFVSERGADLVNENNFGMSNKPYLSIFYAKKEKEYKKAKHFSNQLNSLYHDGPVSISSDQQVIYFSRVNKEEKGKDFTNKLKIFIATLENEKWKNITPFEYNSPAYSVAHPWVSEDGAQLFFASDMPGGFGGMDIYVSSKTGETWGKPVNLGSGVNTAENDVFPYYRAGKLYFSSAGHSGYGGLDIYLSLQEENWATVKNLKAPLNSSKDDFGIFYKDDENGYFSSDREGGIGSDDIYAFKWHALIPQTELSGILEYDKLPAEGTTVNLLDEEDNIIRTTTTDSEGRFVFEKLDQDKNYLLAIDSEDESFLDKTDLYMTNSKGEKVLIGNKVANGKYKFQALPYASYDELELFDEEDESLVALSVYGQVYNKLPGDYSKGLEVLAVDEDGNVIGKTITDENGKFFFEKLASDKSYVFRLAEEEEDLSIIYLDESGNLKKRLTDEEERLFNVSINGQVFQKLPGDFEAGTEIWLVDDEGHIIGKTTTDENGKFSFEKLSPDKAYLFRLAEDDLSILFLDESGKVEKSAKKMVDGQYRYVRLASDKNVIDLINELDEVIKIEENENFVISKILYDFASAEINEKAAVELDKLVLILQKNKHIGVELSSHTDSKGSTENNIQLSQKRADAAVNYVISKGVSKERLIAKGFGESMPVATNLINGQDNPDGRAKNRRTEFKVVVL